MGSIVRKAWFSGLVAGALVVPGPARGAGFGLYEQGARALGSGGAFTARVDDASALFFNPAGLARIEHGNVVGGGSLLLVTREFAGNDPYPGRGVHETSPHHAFFPIHAYWGHRVSRELVVGFGVYNPFGLTTEWEQPESYTGRFISTKASLTPFFFNPAVAVNLTPQLRLGFGVTAVHSTLELRRNVAQPNPLGDPGVLDLGTLVLTGDNGLDFGVNLGFQVDVTDRVTLGGNYRSRVTSDFDGDADFTFEGTGTALDPQLQLVFPGDQTASTSLTFPEIFVAAAAVRLGMDWMVEADLGWTGWSAFDRLDIAFANPSINTSLIEQWEDVFFYRFGTEFGLGPDTRLRLGYYYDETPQATGSVSPILPDNNRHGLSAGIGRTWGRWTVDAFGLVLLVSDRSTDGANRDGYEGTYANGVQILGATVSYRY
jgi:long-chain fatty acid transport protein